MDPLSATASVIAVIQITGQVFNICQTYFQGVKSARKDIKRLRDEVTAFQDALTSVADLADAPDSTQLSNLHLLTKADGLLQRCKIDLEDLVARLQAGMGKDEKMKQFGLRALKWPLSSKEVDRELMVLSRYKETFALALTTDLATLAISIKQCTAELEQDFVEARRDILAIRTELAAHKLDSDRARIIQWLSTTDPSSNHEKACQRHEPATGEWLIKSTEFDKWKSSRNSLLWLHGIPGCGKTILSSTIIERLTTEIGSLPDVAVAYFYFDFSDVLKQHPSDFLSSIIGQLSRRVSKLPEILRNLYKGCNNGNRKPTLRELSAVFVAFAELDDFADIYLVVDALDECPQGDNNMRTELLRLISVIHASSSSSMHVLVTSRPEKDIKEALEMMRSTLSVPLQGSGVDADIRLHIENQLAADDKFKLWSNDVKSDIKEVLTAGANGMFRWVFCQLDALKKCKKAASVRKALTTLPKTLEETYARIIGNISGEYRDDARRALIWMAFSKRPLLLREVAEAAVFSGETHFDPEERFQAPKDVLDLLGSLVAFSLEDLSKATPRLDAPDILPNKEEDGDLDSWNRDFLSCMPGEECVLVNLAHYSVKEYLMSDQIIDSDFGISESVANNIIAKVCLQYIHHYDTSISKTTSEEDLREFPLLYYACEFWYIHLQAVPLGSQTPIGPLVHRLFVSPSELSSWLRVHRPDRWWHPPFDSGNKISSPLYHSSSIGLHYVVQILIQEGADVDFAAEKGSTPLLVAADFEHKQVVHLLLEHKADINKKNKHCHTALHIAAENANEGITRLLLQHNADSDAMDISGNTALHLAVYASNDSIIRLLLEFNANINAQNVNGETPLYLAIKFSTMVIVRLLLQNKLINVNAKNQRGETPLQIAISNKFEEIVGLLLAWNDVDFDDALFPGLINFMDKAMVLLRLPRLADINVKGLSGDTALHQAVLKGNEGFVRLLILYGADTVVKNHRGNTPLHQAAECLSDSAMIQLLLKHKTDINSQNDSGDTALIIAARRGTEGIARELLAFGADANIKNQARGTALHYASPYEGIIQLLIDHRSDINAQDQDGRTSLHNAAQEGFDTVVRALLDHKADVSLEDQHGRTALHEASANMKVTQLLLEHKADVDAQDHDQRTALHFAADRCHGTTVELLLKHKANVDAQSWIGRTALMEAAYRGSEAIVQILLEHNADINRMSGSGGGGTALNIAAYEGHEAVVRVLLENTANKPQLKLTGALHRAIYQGHFPIVRLLIEHKVDLGARDKYGRTPLHCASEWSDEAMRQLLLEHGADPTKDRKRGIRKGGGNVVSRGKQRMGEGDEEANRTKHIREPLMIPRKPDL
ncbi:hypothetical protein MMC30_002065 [Trapelia coarctata]|nr:hypothetical protein [Trapelia coarctata]